MAASSEALGRGASCDDVVADLDLTGRVALVTGSNSGLGYETVRCLALAGARVIVGCRTRAKARATIARVQGDYPHVEMVPLGFDLRSGESIRRGLGELDDPVVDTIVCNAGLFRGKYAETELGVEETMGVCHFGHFLLVHELLERLKPQRGTGRVVMVASDAHAKKIDLEKFTRIKPAFPAYAQAKLCNMLMAVELERRFGERGIHGFAVHPGALIPTNITRHSMMSDIVTQLARPFTKTVQQGAACQVYVAATPGLEKGAGRYFMDCVEKDMGLGDMGAVARQLWERTAEIWGV